MTRENIAFVVHSMKDKLILAETNNSPLYLPLPQKRDHLGTAKDINPGQTAKILPLADFNNVEWSICLAIYLYSNKQT